MKVLALVPDAYGGRGGIAQYNRNVIRALCEHSETRRVVAVPRVVPLPLENLPSNLDYKAEARDSKAKFVAQAVLSSMRGGCDLIVVSHLHLLPVGCIVKAITKAPLVLFVYGLEVWNPRGVAWRRMMRSVDACVGIRPHSMERMARWADLPHRTVILENTIDLREYRPRPQSRALVARYGLEGNSVLLTLSRIDDVNFGVDEVLDVMPELMARVQNLVYIVAGDGRRQVELEEKARQLGVERAVLFTGYLDPEEKIDHYRLADAFAMPGSNPTDFDRYPLRFSFLEAMACGLPIVASRPEEGTDAVSGLDHFYVDPTNREELIAAIEAALAKGRGEPPELLQRWAFPEFRRKLHELVDQLVSGSARTMERNSLAGQTPHQEHG